MNRRNFIRLGSLAASSTTLGTCNNDYEIVLDRPLLTALSGPFGSH